jgi:hypothetical protein
MNETERNFRLYAPIVAFLAADLIYFWYAVSRQFIAEEMWPVYLLFIVVTLGIWQPLNRRTKRWDIKVVAGVLITLSVLAMAYASLVRYIGFS